MTETEENDEETRKYRGMSVAIISATSRCSFHGFFVFHVNAVQYITKIHYLCKCALLHYKSWVLGRFIGEKGTLYILGHEKTFN